MVVSRRLLSPELATTSREDANATRHRVSEPQGLGWFHVLGSLVQPQTVDIVENAAGSIWLAVGALSNI